jgi:8-oxo-dGTP pyrophosphatase MutT (NUDIX family)
VDQITTYPRAKVVCVFRRSDEILLSKSMDSVKGDFFWAPPGGGIEFGESARQAAAREMMEELGEPVQRMRLLGVLENIFEYEGQAGHEILFVMDTAFRDQAPYRALEISGIEGDAPFSLRWERISDFAGTQRLVPDGLYELLQDAMR